MKRAWWILLAMVACKAPASAPGPGSGSSSSAIVVPPPVGAVPVAVADAAVPDAAAAPAWTLETRPIVLDGGADDHPLALPPPAPGSAAPPAERALARSDAYPTCADLASPAAVCKCLVAARPGKVRCAPVADAARPRAQMVELTTDGHDDTTSETTELVLVGAHGSRWSAVAVVDASTSIDRTETPRRGSEAAIERFETRPRADGTLVWIESRHAETESGAGEHDNDGAAALRICVVPTDAAATPYCYEPIPIGEWKYSYELWHDDHAPTIFSLALRSAALDSAGHVTLTLTAGKDERGLPPHLHL